MPVLNNKKHEAFCRAIAFGESGTDAYLKAYGEDKKRETARVNATRLLINATVKARIAELKPALQQKTAEKVAQLIEDAALTRAGRVREMVQRRRGLLDVIAARAVFPDHQWAPGGNTGYVVTSMKAAGKKLIKTHEVDNGLLRSLLDVEKQIAIELGQWVEKRSEEHAGPETWTDDYLDQQIAALKAKEAAQLAAAGAPDAAVN